MRNRPIILRKNTISIELSSLLKSLDKAPVPAKSIEAIRKIDKDLYGTDVATILNKATNENKQNNVEKQDEKYIETIRGIGYKIE